MVFIRWIFCSFEEIIGNSISKSFDVEEPVYLDNLQDIGWKEDILKIGEKILLSLSRDPGSFDFPAGIVKWDISSALNLLRNEYPNFSDLVHGKEILDFGCGEGWQTVAIAKNGAKYVLGLDTSKKNVMKANYLSREVCCVDIAEFKEVLDSEYKRKFDLIISQNSMEHFNDPELVINQMKNHLKPEGMILVTFGPPWFAPYGSHMQFFTRIPWVNLLFSEKTVISVRSKFRHDGATKYEEVEAGLNKMSVEKFERIISSSGLRIIYRKYTCVRGMNFLSKVPVLRELFINHISCALVRSDCPEIISAAQLFR